MMIAACGQKKNPEKKKSEKAEQEETEFKDRESLKLSLFTVYYPKAWNYDKENMKKDEEYSYVRFFDGDTADGSENVISIEATKEDSYTYRKSLIAFGVDLEACWMQYVRQSHISRSTGKLYLHKWSRAVC